MSSIQERLQLKRTPLDDWNVREQLCLASAVMRSGDQNWMSVSRALKLLGEAGRPPDWYSQKSCAVQYAALLEHVQTPKRKKRTSEGAVETPQESILKRLTQERIVEIQKKMTELNQLYQTLKSELNEAKSSDVSEERLKEMSAAIEAERRQHERALVKQQQWLREREEKRIRAEKAWRPTLPTVQTPPPSSGSPGSSPLLTSLLKSSSSPVSIPQPTTPSLLHIPHPSTVVDTMSPSAGAPTLSMLLEKPSGTVMTASPIVSCPPVLPRDNNKNAVIEQIKNQLQEIENQFKAASSPVLPVAPSPRTVPDIDDIEIKEEDVYAFSDIDIEIPPVSTIHKNSNIKISEKPKQDLTATVSTQEEPTLEVNAEPQVPSTEVTENDIPAIEVKTETSIEIEPEPSEEIVTEQEKPIEVPAEESLPTDIQEAVTEEIVNEPENVQEEIIATSIEETATTDENVEEQTIEEIKKETEEKDQKENETEPEPTEKPTDIEKPEPEVQDDQVTETEIKTEFEEPVLSSSQEPTSEDSEVKTLETTSEKVELEEAVETDDDTPMEVVREEEKLGRKRRDYSRRRTDVSDDDSTRLRLRGSGSECSAPGSPIAQAADAERDHRLWKKSVMLVYSRLCAHKCASLFLRPITDDMAPGYSSAIKRPMDLTTIKKNIDSGVIRTTAEFQRDVLLMLSNALMYNSSSHRVHQMAREMHDEAVAGLGVLVQAQAHASLASMPTMPRGYKRKAALSSPGSHGTPPSKRRHE